LAGAEMSIDNATAGNLRLPKRLVGLIDRGLWPRSHAEAQRQNIRSLVSAERIHLFAPEEDRIYLAAPPFCTITRRMSNSGRFWKEWGALDEISPELSVDIGYFGLGSDSAIVLGYRQNPSDPAVIRLKWRKPQPNTWVRCADTFDEFADMLGLDSARKE
jgi:hypothetical protein